MQSLRQANNKDTKKFLQSTPNYDILSNPQYREMFLYVPAATPNRTKHIVSIYMKKEMKRHSCDIVRMCIDMAYFKPEML